MPFLLRSQVVPGAESSIFAGTKGERTQTDAMADGGTGYAWVGGGEVGNGRKSAGGDKLR